MAGYLTSSFVSGPLISRLGIGSVLAGSCALTGAGLIGYTVSAVVILAATRLRGARAPTDRRATPWFVATGMLNGGSVFLMYTALAKGKVALVSPIVATYPLFTLVLSLLLLRQERVPPRVALGAVLTVAGVIMLLSF